MKKVLIIVFILLVIGGSIYYFIKKNKSNYRDVSNQFNVILNVDNAKKVSEDIIKNEYNEKCEIKNVDPQENKIIVKATCNKKDKDIIIIYKDSKWILEQ